MKHFILAICLMTIGSVYASTPNNVELFGNSDFSDVTLFTDGGTGFATSASSDPSIRGKWHAGTTEVEDYNNGGFANTISSGYFDAMIPVDAAVVYNNFLGQVPEEQFTSGRYHLSLRAKGTTPFYIKISSVAVMGTELSTILRNPSSAAIEKQATPDYKTYSIKVMPTEEWVTYSADLDISLSATNNVRIFIVFPKAGEISLDDISIKRTKDLPTTFYVRPTGNTTAWTSLQGIEDDQIISGDALSIVGANTYYLAAGTYTTAAIIALTKGKMYGGFSGNETLIDLNARATSDLDENGIVESWEFTNATTITGSMANSKFDEAGTGTRLLTMLGGEVDGITFTDFNYFYQTYGGPITLGQVSSNPSDNASTSAGKLTRCTIRKIKGGAGVIMSTNSQSVIDRCLIEDNVGTVSYGAVYLNRFGGTVSNSVLRNNKATTKGGAIYAGNGTATTGNLNAVVSNCVIYNNTANQNGGAICGDAVANFSGIEIVNSTIANNSTTTPGLASVELNNNGLLVNSIVLNDNLDEISVDNISNFVERVAYGTLTGSALYPATQNISGKNITDFSFVRPTSVQGYVESYNPEYNAIKKANFEINDKVSAAYVTLATIPASYQIAGSGATIETSAKVPTTDIRGISRSDNMTIGAYSFGPSSTIDNEYANNSNVYGSEGALVAIGLEGETIKIYNLSGQLVKVEKITSDTMTIPVAKGFYLVATVSQRVKVIVN